MQGSLFSTQIIDNFRESFCFGFLFFSLLLSHGHFGVLEAFPLQIRLVSDLDARDDFLDIPKKVFNSLLLYRVQKTQKI
jgi:hypothetical protein